MQITKRVLPPATAASTTTATPSGRSYTAAPGGFLDVPDGDAVGLLANGWVCGILSGPTASRPKTRLNPPYDAGPGALYIDTTLGLVIAWDGAAWRDPTTGNAV